MKHIFNALKPHRSVKVLSIATVAILGLHAPAYAGGNDDPLLAMLKIDQLELREHNDQYPVIIEGDAWLGHDLQKLWLDFDVEYEDSEFEEAIFDVLYGQAIAPYWDARIGIRQTIEPESQTWGLINLKGLAPYYVDIDTSVAITQLNASSALQTHFNITAEHEAMITQRVFASPELSLNAYSRSNADEQIGAGISDISLSLRVGYEIRREFAPYAGVLWSQKLGNTKNLAESSESDTHSTQLVMGVSMWF